jgi:LAO/AO transport system kinase
VNNYRELINKAVKGDRVALGRLLTIIEESPKNAGKILSRLDSVENKSHVIGVTGIPGSGKSTLISKLITKYRKAGYKIAVIAIDPTSPLSKGALLGDRIRMQEHATDPNVFIRSVSTLGLKGGLSFSGVTMIEVFDKLGYDKIFIESIGVGQADTDIMDVAHTIVVVTAPGLGDEIQALKAGIMEIGDIYVLNKSDRPDASRTYAFLEFALESGEIGIVERVGWKPRLIKVSALMGEGVDDLIETIDSHYKFLIKNQLFNKKVLTRRNLLIKLLAEKMFHDELEKIGSTSDIKVTGINNVYRETINIIKSILNKLSKE